MAGEHSWMDRKDDFTTTYGHTGSKGVERDRVCKFSCNAPTSDSDKGSVIGNLYITVYALWPARAWSHDPASNLI